MTETAEVPVLGLGREQTQLWTQAALTIAGVVRERRLELGRLAWSNSEDAARRHDRLERAAQPAVRAMDERERESWARLRDAPDGDIDTRHVDGPAGAVTVSVVPLRDRWGLVAEGSAPDGEHTSTAHISCADEATAKRLADELLASGPDSIERLQGFATLAAERAATASSKVREPEAQRLARATAAVHDVWPGALADAVTSSPAFGALAWRLYELEERGYAMPDVLRRIDDRRLRRADVRDPAALAEFFVEQLSPSLQVINLDTEQGLDAAARRAAGAGDGGRATAREPVAGELTVVDMVLVSALSPALLEAVQDSRGYAAVRRMLHDLYEQGRAVDRLLHDLPLDKVLAADDPAGYLAAVVRRRAEQDQLRATGVDRVAMADLVQEALPRRVADKVTACSAWPALATRLAAWKGQGLPVVDMLASMSAGHVYRARKPAAYALKLMELRAAEQRPRGHGADGAAPEPHAAASRDPGQERAVDGDGVSDADLRWADELDPSSVVDRVGLEATLGLGSPGRNAHVERRLRGAAELEAAAHSAAAHAAEGRAATHDQDAARDRAGADLPDTDRREDLAGDEQARVDEHLAAGQRAAAAEERGAAAAAAARAEVTFTPGTDAAAAADAPARTSPTSATGRPIRTRQSTPSLDRGRQR